MVWTRLLAIAFLSCLQIGCGGSVETAEPPSGAPEPQITVSAEIKSSVRTLGAEEAAQVDISTNDFLDAPPNLNLHTGDVLIVRGQAVKLGSLQPLAGIQWAAARSRSKTAGVAALRFTLTKPRLDEIYSSLVLNGRYTAEIEQDPVFKIAAWKASSLNCSKRIPGINSITAACNFQLEDDSYPLPTIGGKVGGGVVADLNHWDVVKNTGSGKFSFSLDAEAALTLKLANGGVGTLSSDFEKSSCTSGLRLKPEPLSGRVLLMAPSVPLQAGVTLTFPFCMSAGASANLTVDILTVKPQFQLDVLVGEGQRPRPLAPPMNPSISPADPKAAIWKFDPSGTGVGISKAVFNGELAVELGMELVAAQVLYTGFENRVVGYVEASGKAAPAVVGKPFSADSLRAKGLACVDGKMGMKYTLSAFGEIPALSWILGSPVAKKVTAWESNIGNPLSEIWGYCGQTTSGISRFSTSPNPSMTGSQVNIQISAERRPKNDSELLYDEHPSSWATVWDDTTGVRVCSAELSEADGGGQCTGQLSGVGVHKLRVKYDGDKRYTAATATLDHTVVDLCPETGNKFAGMPVTSSSAIYSGELSMLTDGNLSQYVNWPKFNAAAEITLPTTTCFSRIDLLPGSSPSPASLNLTLRFFDDSGHLLGSQSQSITQRDQIWETITLSKPVFGVRTVQIEESNSASWVGWFEIRGY